MTLCLFSPSFPCFSFPSHRSQNYYFLLPSAVYQTYFSKNLPFSYSCSSKTFSLKPKASLSEAEGENKVQSELLDDELISRISAAKDASEVLEIISQKIGENGGVVSASDCCLIISAALDRSNADLALSVFDAMRSTFDPGTTGLDRGLSYDRWRWSRPDVTTYTLLVRGLATVLRVSDALRIIATVCRVGIYPSEEVLFGKVVRCPSCMIAVSVAQPQDGIQVVSCSKCRYQYELVSGNIISIESEEISMEIPAWRRGLRFLPMKQNIPAAVHSIVVETPSGMARTHRFATETVDLPAQEGERVTIAVAAPPNVYREVGPLKFNPKAPNVYPGEPLCLTNHRDGRASPLLRAPKKDKGPSLLNPSILVPLLAVFATGDAASGMIDPNLPQIITVAAVSSITLGATLNNLVFPQLSKLPQRLVDTIAIRQQLLSQYDVLQSRIKELKVSAENEVWMLARMCQLENKIFAVGEPSYRARRSRVKRVRESLERSLRRRIELIESYARISSIIEIEVEMDSDVLAAEAAGNAENIAEQIQQIMELENLEEKWIIQAEANDEAERLLSSEPITTETILER
ncbi:uncharacterized protein LOC107807139 isoform X2 [Nicotiana tabacum]|uniref:Uncharacterized protein LOC107807139 isoform X2 n=1 Tax=Nicotiana tabacum TaxID=4097 RepID=A0A1S4BDE4_TOBAC|nr:uncharacterized protein LOC104096614 isoform X2 [Nicotiana tomentosiformis]XP_016486945.1 PREDICTED: uncharacterized protein LOC107807139 isoform X2 [Nicotiana tabacum]